MLDHLGHNAQPFEQPLCTRCYSCHTTHVFDCCTSCSPSVPNVSYFDSASSTASSKQTHLTLAELSNSGDSGSSSPDSKESSPKKSPKCSRTSPITNVVTTSITSVLSTGDVDVKIAAPQGEDANNKDDDERSSLGSDSSCSSPHVDTLTVTTTAITVTTTVDPKVHYSVSTTNGCHSKATTVTSCHAHCNVCCVAVSSSSRCCVDCSRCIQNKQSHDDDDRLESFFARIRAFLIGIQLFNLFLLLLSNITSSACNFMPGNNMSHASNFKAQENDLTCFDVHIIYSLVN